MSNLYESEAPLHVIEVQLYSNHLKGGANTYLAKNTKERTLTIDEVCGSMKVRGGYEGSIEEAKKTIRHFLKELIYLLCDGFSINLGWFKITVGVSGLFHSITEPLDPKKHKVSFKFHMLKAMREQASHIQIKVNGHIEEPAYVTVVQNLEDPGAPPNHITVGEVHEIIGHRIKIEGNPATVGIWLVRLDDPTQRVKVSRVVTNNVSRIEFIVPEIVFGQCCLEIKTYYSGASNPLNDVRTIKSSFTLEKG